MCKTQKELTDIYDPNTESGVKPNTTASGQFTIDAGNISGTLSLDKNGIAKWSLTSAASTSTSAVTSTSTAASSTSAASTSAATIAGNGSWYALPEGYLRLKGTTNGVKGKFKGKISCSFSLDADTPIIYSGVLFMRIRDNGDTEGISIPYPTSDKLSSNFYTDVDDMICRRPSPGWLATDATSNGIYGILNALDQDDRFWSQKQKIGAALAAGEVSRGLQHINRNLLDLVYYASKEFITSRKSFNGVWIDSAIGNWTGSQRGLYFPSGVATGPSGAVGAYPKPNPTPLWRDTGASGASGAGGVFDGYPGSS